MLNTNLAIFQLYHGKNKLIFNEMMLRFALYYITPPMWLVLEKQIPFLLSVNNDISPLSIVKFPLILTLNLKSRVEKYLNPLVAEGESIYTHM